MGQLSFLFNEHKGKRTRCRKCEDGFIWVGRSLVYFLDVMEHELNSGLSCLVPKQNTAVSSDIDACWGLQHLPALKHIFCRIVGIQVLICVCACKKYQVQGDSDANSQILVSVLEKVSAAPA